MGPKRTASTTFDSRSSILDPRSSILNSPPRAFTLIELMISIALVLLLILGVNQIFTYTTQAVGAGQAINAAIRDSRAAQSQFQSDFSNMVSPGTGPNDSACMIITSVPSPGFRDKTDQAADRDGNPLTRDLKNSGVDGDPTVPGDIIPNWTYNYRNHRLDAVSFFARNLFARQTGNIGTYAASMSSQEAWIWYGHLWLPDNSGTYSLTTLPGAGTSSTNPNNYYATQMVLGRVAILLQEKSGNPPGIQDNAGNPQNYFNPLTSFGAYASDLTPLAGTSVSTDGYSMLDARGFRYDLAATSISGFRSKLQSYLATGNTAGGPLAKWWTQMVAGTVQSNPVINNRFQCNPFVTKPMDATAMAQASPYFLGGCSQFIVEYAGDYRVQQNNPGYPSTYGAPVLNSSGVSTGQDGEIDYVVVNINGQLRKQICWYGLPRNTSGNAQINRFNGDVMPLGVWTNNTAQSFEKAGPKMTFDQSGNLLTMQPGAPYVCAWGPNDIKPKLIRITMTLDDPTGRLPDGQTYQYVFAVP